MVTVKAKFPQWWRSEKYDKDQEIPANKVQARRLTKAGVAYYEVTHEGDSETLSVDRNTDFDSIPAGDVLKEHFNSVNAVSFATDEDLIAIDGIGEKTLEKIRAYFG